MMALHAFCCGLPALAVLAAASFGAASGIALISDSLAEIHQFLHARELWILAFSAALVGIGGGLEIDARRRGKTRGFPWLFGFSLLCFASNLAIIALHRGF